MNEPYVRLDPAFEVKYAVEKKIQEKTWGRVRHLQVEMKDEHVIVRGSTRTYYLKQLAVQAAKDVLGTTCPFLIDIHVT